MFRCVTFGYCIEHWLFMASFTGLELHQLWQDGGIELHLISVDYKKLNEL